MVGDWNAKVGNMEEENVVELYGIEDQNETRDWLLNFCHVNYFFINNIIFKQSK